MSQGSTVNFPAVSQIQNIANWVVENDRPKILWDLLMHSTRKQTRLCDGGQGTEEDGDRHAVLNYINIKKKENGKLKKIQGTEKGTIVGGGMKVKVVPVMVCTPGAVTPKLGEWPQQIPGTTLELSVHKKTQYWEQQRYCAELKVLWVPCVEKTSNCNLQCNVFLLHLAMTNCLL